MDESFDVVVVGAGLAGLAAGATAALGASTLSSTGISPADGPAPTSGASTGSTGGRTPCTGAARLKLSLPGSACRRPGAVPPATGARGRIGDRVEHPAGDGGDAAALPFAVGAGARSPSSGSSPA